MRQLKRTVKIGNITIGGTNPIAVQTMLNVPVKDIAGNVEQAKRVAKAGCQIVRLAVPNALAARALPEMVLPHPGKRPTGFVVICQDKRIDENLNRYQKDVGIVAQTMLLAAVEQGLGGCMIGNFQAGEVMEGIGLPEEIRPLLIVAFGKPAEEIHLVDVQEDGNTNYYRDENDVHYVPKRTLADELLN